MPQKLKKQSKQVKLPNQSRKSKLPPKALRQPKQSKLIKQLNKIRKGGSTELKPENLVNFLFLDARVSTQQNSDPTFTEYGIIHLCDSVAINALRETMTNIANFFGRSGFDSTLYDLARNNCLTRIVNILNVKDKELKQEGKDMDLKVCNIRFEMLSIDPSLITINAYGTLLGKFKTQPIKQEDEEEQQETSDEENE
jgi:hypothetical protein